MQKSVKNRMRQSIKTLDLMVSEAATSKVNMNPTLLQKAIEYRKRNPDAWKKRLEEREQRHKLAIGQDEMSPFFKSYYEAIWKRDEERREKREWQKKQPRKVKIMLQYSATRIPIDPAETKELDNVCVASCNEENSFVGAFKNIVGDEDSEKENSPELMVTVIKGKYLNNGFVEERERAEKCRAVIYMVSSDGSNTPDSMKSYYRYLTQKGSTRWEYRFVYRGLKQHDLQNKYLVVNLVGKNDDRSKSHGQAVLSGPKAVIKCNNGESRLAKMEEVDPLERAFKNPELSETILVDLEQNVEIPDTSLFKLDFGITAATAAVTSSPVTKRKHKKGMVLNTLIDGKSRK